MQEDLSSLEPKFNKILKELCKNSNIKDIIIVQFTNDLKNKNNNAECDPENRKISIRPTLSSVDLLRSLYHEFEHYYQYNYYNWWMDKRKREIYENFYKNLINFIEEDARIFGNAFGKANGRFLFKLIPIENFTRLNGECNEIICNTLDCFEEQLTCHILIQGLLNN